MLSSLLILGSPVEHGPPALFVGTGGIYGSSWGFILFMVIACPIFLVFMVAIGAWQSGSRKDKLAKKLAELGFSEAKTSLLDSFPREQTYAKTALGFPMVVSGCRGATDLLIFDYEDDTHATWSAIGIRGVDTKSFIDSVGKRKYGFRSVHGWLVYIPGGMIPVRNIKPILDAIP